MAARQERRAHRRYELKCPVTLLDGEAAPLQGRTENISNGGIYLSLPAAILADDLLPAKLAVKLSLPRSTPNSFMYEEVAAEATIVRHSNGQGARQSALALRFVRPMTLDLES